MKNVFLLLMAFISLNFINSCREDGDWEKANESFSYTVERDKNFIEKGVGEANQLTFNINPNYNFSKIETSFKFVTSLNGVLKLNGQVLTANQEYTFENEKNVFEYTGNVSGTHDLTISTKNSKGYSVEEKFALPYGVSEFTHTYTGGTADIYQNDETNYLMKIEAGAGQPTTGYQIQFNSYEGTIKLNGVNAELGKFYSLPNIASFNVVLASNKVDQTALHYTIKNATVSKDYSIQQNIKQRQIVIESISINSESVAPNTALKIISVLKKSPQTSNQTIKYKSWISSASNSNLSGIDNTNNVYQNYALGTNGNFTYDFNAKIAGTYTYNIQFQDEFGNETPVKSFTIVVQNSISLTNDVVNFFFKKEMKASGFSGSYNMKHIFVNPQIKAKVTASNSSKISKIVVDVNYDYNNSPKTKTYTYNYNDLPQEVDFNQSPVENITLFEKFGSKNNLDGFAFDITKANYKIYVYNNLGEVKIFEGAANVTFQ